MTRKTKLSGSVDMLHCYMDKMKQVNGERAIRQRKRQEKRQMNKARFAKGTQTKTNKRQKDQIQRGFLVARRWKDEK